jgi:predicted nucleotidyltransferase component of viral defense system
MPEWSKLLLGKQAKELGFVRDTYEKVCRLTEILKFFENDVMLGNSLALKGGTAINLTIFNLPRLSVDHDLDFLKNVSRDEMMETRSIIND